MSMLRQKLKFVDFVPEVCGFDEGRWRKRIQPSALNFRQSASRLPEDPEFGHGIAYTRPSRGPMYSGF